jgi:hypothetical protein
MGFVRYVGRIKVPAPTNASQRSPNYVMDKEKEMPLVHGKSKKAISENIATEMHEGKPHDQAVAIGLNVARESGAKIPMKHHKKENHSSPHHRHKEHR